MTRACCCVWMLLMACGEERAPGDGPPATVLPGTDAGGPGPGPDTPTDPCGEGRARWVYVVDDSNQLLRFEPDSLQFFPIGTLSCELLASPFSMAVDRNATAWVLYNSGSLFSVSTVDASCTPTSFIPSQSGFDLFGMGFVADDPMGNETLFVAGGSFADVGTELSNNRLATIDLASMVLTPRGESFSGSPELTGTGDGQLWGFFPGLSPTARRIHKDTAQAETTIPITAIAGDEPRAWAWAFWGGRFYIFLQSASDLSTNVYRLTPETMASEQVLMNTGYSIVGAGVSTCAPVELI